MALKNDTARVLSTATVAAAVVAAGALPASARMSDDGGAELTSRSQLAGVKHVNVVGLPMRVPVPSTWAVTSPRERFASGSTTYPLIVRTQARAEGLSPARWLSENRDMSVLAVLHPGYTFSQGMAVHDIGATTVPFAALKQAINQTARVTTTSQVQTRFGMAYRVHHTGRDAASGLTYRGVTAIMRVAGHTVVVDTVGLTAASAQFPSDLALKGAAAR